MHLLVLCRQGRALTPAPRMGTRRWTRRRTPTNQPIPLGRVARHPRENALRPRRRRLELGEVLVRSVARRQRRRCGRGSQQAWAVQRRRGAWLRWRAHDCGDQGRK